MIIPVSYWIDFRTDRLFGQKLSLYENRLGEALFGQSWFLSCAARHAPLRSALRQAVKLNLIHSNACDAVELPRHKAREIQCLTREQANSLIAVRIVTRTEPNGRTVTVENKHRTLFSFMLCTARVPLNASQLSGLTSISAAQPSRFNVQ